MSGERHDADGPEIRAISEGELDAWVRAHDASYLLPTPEGALALPLVLYLIAPEPTTRRLTAFNAWLRARATTLIVAVLIVAGAIMIGAGAYGLLTGK